MRTFLRDVTIFFVATLISLLATRAIVGAMRSPTRGLPYRDGFARDDTSGWVAYDGNWNVHSGVMMNESNERGAKIVTGSPYWKNYAMDADVALSSTGRAGISPGEAGIIARVSKAERGVDSYRGVYVGLRVRDESLVAGVANFGWNELATKPLSHPIVPNVWYHIRLVVKGCELNASTWRDGRGKRIRLHVKLTPCLKRGRIGLRSYNSGGEWKDIRVTALKG